MGKQFINGGSVDKISIEHLDKNSCIKMQVIGDTKNKKAEADLEIEISHTDGYKETILHHCDLKKGKSKCFCNIEINVPYDVKDVKITSGTVRRV